MSCKFKSRDYKEKPNIFFMSSFTVLWIYVEILSLSDIRVSFCLGLNVSEKRKNFGAETVFQHIFIFEKRENSGAENSFSARIHFWEKRKFWGRKLKSFSACIHFWEKKNFEKKNIEKRKFLGKKTEKFFYHCYIFGREKKENFRKGIILGNRKVFHHF